MNNFEFEHNGQKLWYSRSLACNLIIFKTTNYDPMTITHVLANKRGQGCEFNKGLWNLPGGFIDFGEDAIDCALRETFEECGVDLKKRKCSCQLFKLDTKPTGKRQTMVATYVILVDEDEVKDWELSNKNSEPDEVETVEWVNVNELDKYKWTNNQKNLINDAYLNYFLGSV